MTLRRTIVLSALACLLSAERAHAQRASIAVGAAVPAGDFSNTAGTGIDAQFQVRTEPMIGPLALRIEIGYDRFAGKGASASTTFSGQAISILCDFGTVFYWAAGPATTNRIIRRPSRATTSWISGRTWARRPPSA